MNVEDSAWREAQGKHSLTRSLERYGIEMTERDLKTIVFMIGRGMLCEFICYAVYPRTVWAIYYYQKWYFVVFDPCTRQIATFLPPDGDTVSEWYQRKKAGLNKIPRINEPARTKEQEQAYQAWAHGKGTIILDPRNPWREMWHVELLNGTKFRVSLYTRTRQVLGVEAIE